MCEKKNLILRDFVLEGKIEHSLIDKMLKKLDSTLPGEDGNFKAALSVIKELLEHHVLQDEEEKLFPQIREAFTEEERNEMGKFLDEYKKKLVAR